MIIVILEMGGMINEIQPLWLCEEAMKDKHGRPMQHCPTCNAMTPRDEVGLCIPCQAAYEKLPKHSQIWSCRKCKKTGAVSFVDDESPESVIYKIMDSHRNADPLCPGDLSDLEVHAPIDGVN